MKVSVCDKCLRPLDGEIFPDSGFVIGDDIYYLDGEALCRDCFVERAKREFVDLMDELNEVLQHMKFVDKLTGGKILQMPVAWYEEFQTIDAKILADILGCEYQVEDDTDPDGTVYHKTSFKWGELHVFDSGVEE